MMKEKKGSITVYLCLLLTVMVTLVLTLMDSARLSCGRAVAEAAADEGLFSIFGGYDKILYEDYGILLVDGGYNTGKLNAGALMDEFSESLDAVISNGTSGSGLFDIDITGKAVTGCLLATDENYLPLREQICSFMVIKLGSDVIEALADKFSGTDSVINAAEETGELDIDSIDEDLQDIVREAAEAKEADTDTKEEVSESGVEVPAELTNPIDTVNNIRRLGLMAFTLPSGKTLSSGTADISLMAKNRDLSEGFGLSAAGDSYTLERVMLAKYLTDMFPSFLDDDETDGLRYQVEYAVAGKDNDIDNLKSVMNRLLVIREVLNYIYLNTDSTKKAEAEAVAAVISALLLIPEFVEGVTQILLLCWAYAESVYDVKTLLAGGKVPLLKDNSSWKLSLSSLADISDETGSSSGSSGFSYEEYLFMLLLLKSPADLGATAASLLEYNRRIKGSSPDFSIDTCIAALETEISGTIGTHKFTLTRAYGYDM